MDRKRIEMIFADELRRAGYKKRRRTWFLDQEEAVLLLNLQGSRWGPQFYVNLAVWFKHFGDNPCPREEHCHVRVRWESALPDRSKEKKKELADLLDLEDASISDDTREARIRLSIRDVALPFLARLHSVESLGNALSDGHVKQWMLTLNAKQLLGIGA